MPLSTLSSPGRVGALAVGLSTVALLAAAPVQAQQPPLTPAAFAAHLDAATRASIDAYPGSHRRQLRERLEARDQTLRDAYDDAYFLPADDRWSAWLADLTARIAAANPEHFDRTPLLALVSRSPAANASCYGNGVVTVDLGLLARAPSEAAVAFAVCHELAHQALDHVDERYAVTLDALYDKDTQRRLRRARRNGGLDDFLALDRQLAFDFSRHTRYGEREADSLGLVLYRAAGFDDDAPADLMHVLAKADQPAYDAPIPLAQLLDTEAYPFDDTWTAPPHRTVFLRKEVTLSDAARDSLRTHPDVGGRLAALARAGVDTAAAPAPDLAYRNTRPALRRRLAAGAFAAQRLDLALYYALRGVEADPADAWSRGAAALALAELADARAQLDFTAVAPLPSKHSDEHVRALSEWLHRLRRIQLQSLAYAYAAEVPAELETPGSLVALTLTADVDDDALRAAEARLRNYPDLDLPAWIDRADD